MAQPLINQLVALAGQVDDTLVAYPTFLKQVEQAGLEP